MSRIWVRILRMPFEWIKFASEYIECRSNGSNLYSNASNPIGVVRIGIRKLQNPLIPVRMVQISFQMVWIALEWFEFAFECFESHSIGSNLHSNAFKWVEFAFECFEFRSNGLNLHSNASNPVRMVRIGILMVQVCIQMPIRMVRIWIRIVRIPFKWFEFAFECFKSHWSGSNLHSNPSNPVRMVWFCIQILRIPFEWFKFPFECFESC